MDEHRLGLKPLTGKVWAPRGQRPVVRVQQRFAWLYLYAFAGPQTGNSQYWLLPEVSAPAFGLVLAACARDVGAGPDKRVVLVLDGAGWHTAGTLKVPDGLDLVFLPPYSPELQPAERLWALTDEPLKNRHVQTLAHLASTLAAQCVRLEHDLDRVRAHTLFHWWPHIHNPQN